ncbi:MAG: CarD family transcriptional regulator [Hespellia sp.]|nr:CarD family transcriptional regulator [Hespellia sp.]
MFQKKDVIFSEAIGVCHVADITKLGLKNEEPVPYYLLRSVYDKKKMSYIPVEDHKVTLRTLITVEQAKAMQQDGTEKDELIKGEIRYVLERSEARIQEMKKEETHV